MRAVKTFSILIWINTSRVKNDEAEVYARITVNLKRANISLRKKVEIRSWDSNRFCMKGNGVKARILNLYLEQVRADIFQVYQELKAEKEIISAQTIKVRYRNSPIVF
jgi:predicted pyridoxine 5'-phosphate oxidase superfamily flavin-nucleotide-binding protein